MKPELTSQPESKERPGGYDAIFALSYSLTKREDTSRRIRYNLTYFSIIECRATYELWKDQLARTGKAPKVYVEGADIFGGGAPTDAYLMKRLLIKLGMNEESIQEIGTNTNTYNQLLNEKDIIKRHKLKRVINVYCDFHKRVPVLLDKFGISPFTDEAVAEKVLSEKYPSFKTAFDRIKQDPSYIQTVELEERMLKVLRHDPQAIGERILGRVIFPFLRAEVITIKRGKVERHFACHPLDVFRSGLK